MSKGLSAIIQPELIIWARKYAYLTKEEAAKRIGISVEKLTEWEDGLTYPTVNQLHDIARIYKQPFAVFYLAFPPKPISLQVRDFRRLPGKGLPNLSPEIAGEIRKATDRREIYLDLHSELGEPVHEFSLSLSINDNLEKSSEIIRKELGVSVEKQQSWKEDRIAFNSWRTILENFGVMVFQSSELALSETRGFSIGDFPLPVIVVNRKDTYTGRVFTLMHEFIHILLRMSGICETVSDNSLPPEKLQIEIFCNKMAAEVLMPSILFREEYRKSCNYIIINEPSDSIIRIIASKFGVSREAAVRRMLTIGLVDDQFYQEKRAKYLKQYKQRGNSTGFVPPAKNAISLSGKPYISLVLNAFDSNKITTSDVSSFLGVKIKHIKELGQIVGVR